jgi:hypothetical protein
MALYVDVRKIIKKKIKKTWRKGHFFVDKWITMNYNEFKEWEKTQTRRKDMTQVIENTNGTKTGIMDNEAEYKDIVEWMNRVDYMELHGHGFDMDAGFWVNYTQVA